MNDNWRVSATAAANWINKAHKTGATFVELAEGTSVGPKMLVKIANGGRIAITVGLHNEIKAVCEPWSRDAARLHAHMLKLEDVGYTSQDIATLIGPGVSRRRIERLRTGVGIRPDLAAKILAIEAHVNRKIATPLGAQRRLRALVSWGYWITDLSQHLGVDEKTVVNIIEGNLDPTSHELAKTITQVFGRLEQIPGPSNEARRYGERHEWPIPFQWNEYTIDKAKSKLSPRCSGKVPEPIFENPSLLLAYDGDDERLEGVHKAALSAFTSRTNKLNREFGQLMRVGA